MIFHSAAAGKRAATLLLGFVVVVALALLWGLRPVVRQENRNFNVEGLLVPAAVVADSVPAPLVGEENFDLPGAAGTKVRRWQVGDSGVVLRLEVSKARNLFWGDVSWRNGGPEGGYREDFSQVTVSTLTLASADNAEEICVHGQNGECRVSSFWLRFGQFLVLLSLADRESGATREGFAEGKLVAAVADFVRAKLGALSR
ncbi:hypothetical protein [Micromonospora chokoriensis]|uniref:hypothetical protein n=1 Tax=Micromonospora chokoriensis TaxID=356851 RepID=UPI0012FBE1DE|nr:hypothetical protein [Micromonospora chokoriensis]